MDRKWMAAAVLSVVLVVLVFLLAQAMQPPKMAFAQGGRFANYVAGTVTYAVNFQAFVVIDTATRRMIFYRYNINNKQLEQVSGNDLARDFGRAGRAGRAGRPGRAK